MYVGAVKWSDKNMSVVILFFIFGSALSAMVPFNEHRIVGGTDTTIEKYPFMAIMEYGNSWFWSLRCGATIITSTVLLSAAHCYASLNQPSTWRARVGTTAAEGGTIHYIQTIKNHENYSSLTYQNDVALLKLIVPLTLNDRVAVARIAGPYFNLPDDTVVTALGWGTLYSNGPLPENLQEVDVNVINQQICASRYKWLQTQPVCLVPGAICPDVTEHMMCTGILNLGGKDACQGDSGGPVVYSGDIVVGVTSWGYLCADPINPGVNARVSYYSDWISLNAVQL